MSSKKYSISLNFEEIKLPPFNDILIEDCTFSYFSGAVGFQRHTGEYLRDIKIRRSTLLNSYSYSSHSQGLYVDKVDGLLVEECFFDHNGWLVQGAGDGDKAGGSATMFNHNVYITATNDIVLRGNAFLRSSSIQNKMTSNNPGESVNILIEDNLYVDGEIGISIGGNTEDSLRFVNSVIQNNVMMYMGKSRPTGRDLAWYIEFADNVNSVANNNLLVHQTWSNNAFVFEVTGYTQRGLDICNNIIYNIKDKGIRLYAQPGWRDVSIRGNIFHETGVGMEFMYNRGDFSSVTYADNIYYMEGNSVFARIENSPYTHSEWVEAVGETGSEYRNVNFPNPERNVESYYSSVGGDGTYEGFINRMRSQNRDNWDPLFTASVINEYMREGFNMEKSGVKSQNIFEVSDVTLSQNYPNPFNPVTTIQFSVANNSKVSVDVYNIAGVKIASLVSSQKFEKGTHSVMWNGKTSKGFDAPSGVYFYRLKTDNYTQMKKMILLR